MKQSGIDWIGEIPDDWKIVQPKALFSQRKERAHVGDEQLTASQKHGIINQKKFMEIEQQRVVVVEKDFNILKHVEPGDFVISMRSFQGGLEYSQERGCISSAYVMLIPNLNFVYPEYYKWLFKSYAYIKALQSTSDLIRDGQALRYSNFAKIPLPLVPRLTQERIAEYLDKKVSDIDSIIEESKKSIEEYKAWKQSVIFEAVTGKNLNCKKKDSGIEWIGEIPEEWKVRKVKYSTKLISGYPFDSNVLTSSGKNIVIRIGDIKNGTVDIANANKSDFEIDGLSNFAVEKDDVLVAMSGATVGKLGYIYTPIKNAYINQRVGILRSSNSKFLYYALNTDKFIEYIMLKSNGSAQPNISNDDIKNYPICVPPLPEQKSITKMLDSKCAQIDSLITEKESLIADLTEYKKSLIFEVVTGKRSI